MRFYEKYKKGKTEYSRSPPRCIRDPDGGRDCDPSEETSWTVYHDAFKDYFIDKKMILVNGREISEIIRGEDLYMKDNKLFFIVPYIENINISLKKELGSKIFFDINVDEMKINLLE